VRMRRASMYQLNGERAELYASMDAGDSTAFMRLASASSVVGAERLRDRDFFGFSLAVTEALGEDFGRERPSKSEFSFSTNLMSRSARRPSSDAFRLLKNQSKLNCHALRISTLILSQLP
jgi:hypothetical protein